jgi:hypothetical protein
MNLDKCPSKCPRYRFGYFIIMFSIGMIADSIWTEAFVRTFVDNNATGGAPNSDSLPPPKVMDFYGLHTGLNPTCVESVSKIRGSLKAHENLRPGAIVLLC